MRTAVLIHGCHLQADGWHDIVWGAPQSGRLGRVPKGIAEALKHEADLIVFSTGASEKDGYREGEYTYRYALAHMNELFARGGIFKKAGSAEELAQWVRARAKLELTSTNTREEVIASALLATDIGIEKLILVSSPSHIMRCHKEAISALGAKPMLSRCLDNLYAVASDTCFVGTTVEDVVIVEPPHRGDQPKWQTYQYVRGMFKVLRQGEETFEFFLQRIGYLLKDFGVDVNWKPRP